MCFVHKSPFWMRMLKKRLFPNHKFWIVFQILPFRRILSNINSISGTNYTAFLFLLNINAKDLNAQFA